VRRSGVLLILLLPACGALAADYPDVLAEQRRFTVRDSVEMSYFGNIRSSMPDDLDDDGLTSPDGRMTIKVTHRGVLPEGVIRGTIWLFDAAKLRAAVNDERLEVPKPDVLATMSATASGGLGLNVLDAGNTVTQPRWSPDSRGVSFLGRDGRRNRQIFRVDVATREIKALTPPTQDVIAYSQSGSTVAYLVGPDADEQERRAWVSAGPGVPDIVTGTGTPLLPLLYPNFRGNAYSEPLSVELWKVETGGNEPVIDTRTQNPVVLTTIYDATLVSLSPDARYAIAIGSDHDDIRRYLVVDLRSGVSKPLSPYALNPYQYRETGRYKAAWSPDGANVAVTELMLTETPNSSNKSRRCGVLVLDPHTSSRVHCIADPQDRGKGLVHFVGWTASDQIEVHYKVFDGTKVTAASFGREKSRWLQEAEGGHGPAEPLLLTVREALNQPPVLHVRDLHTCRSRDVFDPNPPR
jgi:hypothetical protein